MAKGRLIRRVAVTVGVLLGAGALVAGNVVAGMLTAVPATYPFGPNNEVLAVDGTTVTVVAGSGSSLPGSTWGLQSEAGYVRMVELLSVDGERATWRVEGPRDQIPSVGDPVRVDEVVAPGDPTTAVGLPHEELLLDAPVGPLPAWLVPAAVEPRGTVVFVHAYGYTREQGNRFLPALTAAGWDVLLPAYRGDPGAPPWPDDRVLFGTRAWQDVEAAVAVAADRPGAVVLFGASLGGAIVAQLLDRSPLAGEVDALVLDGPTLSLDETVDLQADRAGVPGIVQPVLLPLGQLVADLRFGLDSGSLEQVADDGTFAVPTLLVRSGRDAMEPPGPAARLAATVDTVRLEDFAEAGHVAAWNVDRERYERVLVEFLDAVG